MSFLKYANDWNEVNFVISFIEMNVSDFRIKKLSKMEDEEPEVEQ